MSRPLAIFLVSVIASAAVAACNSQARSGSPSSPFASPSHPHPPPVAAPVRLRPPAEAALGDAVVGSPRRAARDHVTAAEAARDQGNQAAALLQYTSWGWIEASTRTWGDVDETVLLTARAEGAARAFAAWSQDAAAAPMTVRPCPDAVSRLDDCRLGVAGDRALVIGRLDAAVFRLACPASAAERLGAAQAAALRS